MKNKIKPIAFYLPQYHTIPENDLWWGNGFTEWTNVKKAKPNFKGHYQPHIPNSYYDLTDPKVMKQQAELAQKYGLYGFCFYWYWFNGKQVLEKPVYNFKDSTIEFPYCLCWANENWTRTWDGQDHDVLLKQDYQKENLSHEFIERIIP